MIKKAYRNIEFFVKEEGVINTIVLAAFALLLFAIPFNPLFAQVYIVILASLSLFKIKNLVTTPKILLFISSLLFVYFFTYLSGLIYSDYLSEGVISIKIKALFIFLPLIFLCNQKFLGKYYYIFEYVLFLGLVTAFFYTLLMAFLDEGTFFYNLRANDIHHTYLALVYIIGEVLLINRIISKIDEFNFKIFFLYSITLILIGSFIHFIGSCAGLLTFFFIIFLSMFFALKNIKTLVFLMSFVLLAGLAFFFNPDLKRTANDIKENQIKQKSGKEKSSESSVRLVIWENTIELIREKPFIGYGTGGELKVLKEKFKSSGCEICYENNFNAHNQILSILLETGLIGLVPFALFLLYLLLYALKKKNFVLLAVLSANFSFLLVESTMNRFAGIVIFIVFIYMELLRSLNRSGS